MSLLEIGCCGAYCATCPALSDGVCRGCKIGYQTGERDLAKARCKMKVCCLQKEQTSCADCPEFASCPLLQGFFAKKGHEYGRYRKSLEFIHANGYQRFLELADRWRGPYGRLS